jgi:16S rRNA processing protein RimM
MELLDIGRIVRSHGLTGQVKVLSYLESQGVLDDLDQVAVGRNVRETKVFFFDAVQKGKGSFIVKLRGIESREAAAALVGLSLWIPSEKMKGLSDDEYYWHEIIGLEVVTEDDRSLGKVVSVFPTGSNDVYVCRGNGREILLPAIGDVVRRIDRDRKVMEVRLLEGLADP